MISKPLQGACFFFELEADTGGPVAGTSRGPKNVKDEAHAPFDFRTRTILLAEDVEINREIVEIMLAETGVNILSVDNGKAAVDEFSADPGKFDLILMDVQMPVLDGLSATKQIHALDDSRAGQIPIIAMTANAFREDIETCLSAGMNGHIAKPFVVENLFEVLEKYL